jgi:hypothetical protein
MGLPMLGIPLALAGGAMEGGSRGGAVGAVMGAGMAGAQQLIGGGVAGGLDNIMKGLSSPVDLGPMTGFSAGGSPYTIPGVRTNPIQTHTPTGEELTVPKSPREMMGGS